VSRGVELFYLRNADYSHAHAKGNRHLADAARTAGVARKYRTISSVISETRVQLHKSSPGLSTGCSATSRRIGAADRSPIALPWSS
jgi:hypothetical protein